MSTPRDVPEHVAKSILARATELDARSPMVSIDELRAIAAELDVSPSSLEAALKEHQEVIPGPATAGSPASLLVAASGLPLGVVAGSVLSTVPLLTAAPVLTLVAGAGLLSSGALLILQSRNPSLRSYIGHNTALWGGVIAGSLSAIAVLGSGAATELPWLLMIGFGVRRWISSTVLGSAAVIAMRRGHLGKGGNAAVQSAGSEQDEPGHSTSRLKRLLGWLNVTRLAVHRASASSSVVAHRPAGAVAGSA